ncbi:MAG: ParB/RepB/Spo0J family partition protein [Chloroflexota bacterium]|nr:ParB/RepB/Spo0J family partition protein [Chloroflexota bacterium]
MVLAPRVWRDTRWVGCIAGYATTPDLLAGAISSADQKRSITRIYAAACADLAQSTLAGLAPRSDEWNSWFAGLRSAARELSPAHGNSQVVQRALFHGARLESADASWAHQLRRGFSSLLAASLPEPVPALIGEDIDTFRAADARWLAHQSESPCSEEAPMASCEIPLETTRWPLRKLRPNPLNPRGTLDPAGIDDLVASVVAHALQGGILQPLLVTTDGTVVAGHRRLAAARRAGLIDVPVIVRALSPVEALELALVENLQRADLTPVEEARAYQHLVSAGATLASIARHVGVPASRVRERLSLLELDERVRERVHRGDLPMRVALLLLPLRDPGRQWRLASTAIRRRLTIAQVRGLVETALALPPPPGQSCCLPLPADDEPDGAGLSVCRQTALEALRGEADRHISFRELAALAEMECCACGLASTPTVCADCPNLHLLQAVARHGTGGG